MNESISTPTTSDFPQQSLLKSVGLHVLPGALTTVAILVFKPLLDSSGYPVSMEKPHPDGSCGKQVVVIDNSPEYISPCDGFCTNRSHYGFWSPVMPENVHPFEKMCRKII